MRYILQPSLRVAGRFDEWLGDNDFVELAVMAEQAGFDAIAETDHPFPPAQLVARGGHHSLDLFVALSFAAARTRRLKVMTNIMVTGYRNPYLAAKACATLDKLSGGRLILGMAAGYVAEEFAALGGSFEQRGRRFDEAISAMRSAWTGDVVHRNGFFPADGHVMAPSPATPGGPPIWIGGNSERAARRAVELGDGWMPMPAGEKVAAFAGTVPLASLEVLAARVSDVQRRREELGKPPLDIAFGSFSLTGDNEARFQQLARDSNAYEDAGVTAVPVLIDGRSFAETAELVQRFHEVVLAAH
ncbi:TIGR03619 family F420-dependent LLM class oxidoreductase [Trujillonella humicola]|uniref:TIGR03619 family F420-dependent LLM class oxidoreductase n=1 Tax=Trujillonella humicola TaxID=3383699 RepID=UPI003906AFD9